MKILLWLCFALVVAQDDAAKEKPRILRLFADEFVAITPGKVKFPASFEMGTAEGGTAGEKPVHVVQFQQPFYLAKYEVTQELYEVVMGTNPSRWKGRRNSVEMVNWSEANEFCKRATDQLRRLKLLGDDEIIRLPTEAEWEYSCRAGTKTAYSFGDAAADLRDHAWFNGNAKGEDPPVGKKKPNAWGLYDMHGYIWEWCQDAWQPNYENTPKDGSPVRNDQAKERVMRGGSWADPAESCRSAFRGHAATDHRSDAIGFRCVRAKKGVRDGH